MNRLVHPLRDLQYLETSGQVPYREALLVWLRVAVLSFGGPAGQIAVMHRILVEEKRWLSEQRFLHALNYCMLLPGPEAQQLATYSGWLLHRTIGGLSAGLLFILPGFVSILSLSVLYTSYSDLPAIEGLFYGLKPAVIAIVVEAVIRIGKRSLNNRIKVAIACLGFIAIFFLQIPFPIIIAVAALVGYLLSIYLPEAFNSKISQPAQQAEAVIERDEAMPSLRKSAVTLVVGLVVWLAPVILLLAYFGPESVYSKEAVFFSKVAVVTFGGAYSVLSYVAEQCVDVFHWLKPGEMLDGLGMAETTPGPLIQVVQFVGFMGAYREPGQFSPLVAGILGSLITTWVTFAPCFLWIFLGAPYVEALRSKVGLNAALSAITACVVGVILNLSLWFSAHTLFASVDEIYWPSSNASLALRFLVPELASIDLVALSIALLAMLAMLRFKVGMLLTLAACAGLGVFIVVAQA